MGSLLHAPSQARREKIVVYGDNGGGKSSVTISILDWFRRTKSNRKVHLFDTNNQWQANRELDGGLDQWCHVVPLKFEEYNKWRGLVIEVNKRAHVDDVIIVDMMSTVWDAAQQYYWSQKSGNDSMAELWLRNSAGTIAGDHGKNWGVINKFYFEFAKQITEAQCHVIMLATASPIRQPNEAGKGGDDIKIRNFYGKTEMKMDGQWGLRGEGFTVIHAFEVNGSYRITTVKEMGPLTSVKRERVVNKDITGIGFVPGYLLSVAGWRP